MLMTLTATTGRIKCCVQSRAVGLSKTAKKETNKSLDDYHLLGDDAVWLL
jgi:hypothetical protein